MTRDEALATLRGLGLREADVQTLFAHFDDCERRGKLGHGHSRIAWLETVEFDSDAVPELLVADDAYDRWAGGEGLGIHVHAAVVRPLAERPPERVRHVACSPPKGTNSSAAARPAITSPQVIAPIETSATSGRPSELGTAIATGFVPVSGSPPAGWWSRRGEVAVSTQTSPPTAACLAQ